MVVVDGADKLREGAKVEVVTRDAPSPPAPEAAPRGSRHGAGEPVRPGRRIRLARSQALWRLSGAPAMNPSRLFILRPVATTLLMVAILLAGIVAYRVLPLSALPEVDYPTIQVVTLYPGASPDVMTSSVTAPLERQFGQMPGLEPDVVDELGRRVGDHAAVQPRRCARRRRAGSAGGDQRRGHASCRPTCRSRRSTTRSIRPTRRSSRSR